MFDKIRGVARIFKKTLQEELEHSKGKAVSRARKLLGATMIPQVTAGLQPYKRGEKFCLGRRPKGRGPFIARPIAGARIRMLDGRQYVFFSDGSLRHAFGRAVGKMAVKAAKRAKRLKAYRTKGSVSATLAQR